MTEKLLLSAASLEDSGHRPFSAEDLVVSAWRNYPDTFGLAGHRDIEGHLSYPDSNRVFAEIMGSKPIRKRGLLRKVGKKMYQLTQAGREAARLLSSQPGGVTAEKAGLPREIEEELRRLFGSKAAVKYRNGQSEEITFFDACSFWGISPRSSAIELEGRVANLEAVVGAPRQQVQGKSVTFEHGGIAFGTLELDVLLSLHKELLKRFEAEITIIKRRTDERR